MSFAFCRQWRQASGGRQGRGAKSPDAPPARWRYSRRQAHMPGRRSMSVILGSGEHRYRVVENWAKLPDGWSFKDVAAVGVDSKDQVYVFNRGEHPVIVFDRDGNFLRSWGEGVFARAHGLDIDKNDVL